MIRPLVTGAAAVTPVGRDLEATRTALAQGKSGVLPVELPADHPGSERRKPSSAARILTFTTEPELPRAKARRFDRGSQFSVVATLQCLRAAGWTVSTREERTGIVFGTGSAGATPLSQTERQMAVEGPDAASPFLFPYTVANAATSQAAIELGIMGPNITLIQKDPAGLNAALYSSILLNDRRADSILAGAVDEWTLDYHLVYERLGVLRSDRRPGFLLGEGASCVLLEHEDSVAARGALAWARLAATVTRTEPVSPHRRRASAEALARLVSDALAQAGPLASSVGLVHLSANGFPSVDEAEQEALRLVFGNAVPREERIKDSIGENPCSGAAQLALAAATLRDIPETGAVLVNAFGAGGNSICAVLTLP